MFDNSLPRPVLVWLRRLTAALLALGLALPVHAQSSSSFSREELEQIMAPIALYPDSLLAQVLMASTYPAEVQEASQWAEANKERYKGDDAVKQVDGREWDPSVKSLVAFPSVLAMMRENIDWTQNVGDAFLGQRAEVMNAVQALRVQAEVSGNLKSSEQVKVVKQQQTIVIEPASPQVVYVPQYNPTVVYGAWPYPSYPPVALPPPPGYYIGSAIASGIAWGVGIGVANAIWGGFDWGRNDVNINVNRFNNIHVNQNNFNSIRNNNWNHNSVHRRNVAYNDRQSRERFQNNVRQQADRRDLRQGGGNRDRFADREQNGRPNRPDRGDRPGMNNRAGDRQAFDRPGNDRTNVGDRTGDRVGMNRPVGDRAGVGGRPMPDRGGDRMARPPTRETGAFHGLDNRAAGRAAADRGRASREAMNRPSPQMQRPAAQANRPAPQMNRAAVNRPAGARPAGGGGGARPQRHR